MITITTFYYYYYYTDMSEKNGPKLDDCMELILMHGYDADMIMKSSRNDAEELLATHEGKKGWQSLIKNCSLFYCI